MRGARFDQYEFPSFRPVSLPRHIGPPFMPNDILQVGPLQRGRITRVGSDYAGTLWNALISLQTVQKTFQIIYHWDNQTGEFDVPANADAGGGLIEGE